MPQPHASGLVLWQRVKHYSHPGATDYSLGFVSAYSMHLAIQVSVIAPNKPYLVVKEGVKFISDPTVAELDWTEGVWDFYELDLPRPQDLDDATHPLIRQAVERLAAKRAAEAAQAKARIADEKRKAEEAKKALAPAA